MHIYIRHGNDEKKSNFKHDHSLNSSKEIKQEIIHFTNKLIMKYGYPDKIYCSPFKRVRSTVKIMKKILNNNVEIIVDPKLSRYFTKKEQEKPEVRDYTLKYKPPIYENTKLFKKRVDKFYKKVDQQKDKNIWCITHYLVIKHICKKKQIEIPKRMPFLYNVNL